MLYGGFINGVPISKLDTYMYLCGSGDSKMILLGPRLLALRLCCLIHAAFHGAGAHVWRIGHDVDSIVSVLDHCLVISFTRGFCPYGYLAVRKKNKRK